VKRFTLEDSTRKQSIIGTNADSRLLLLSDEPCPRFEIKMGGDDAFREPFVIDAEEFIGVKTFKAKGKRLTNWTVDAITKVEPREPAPVEQAEPVAAPTDDATADDTTATLRTDGISQDEVLDQFTGQQRIPFDE
jgi:topoisomerase-4 subunit A